jgi:hypothetical protein
LHGKQQSRGPTLGVAGNDPAGDSHAHEALLTFCTGSSGYRFDFRRSDVRESTVPQRQGSLGKRARNSRGVIVTLLVISAVTAEVALAAHPTGGARYKGQTAQKEPMSFKVNSKATRIVKLNIPDLRFPKGDPCVDPESNPVTSKDVPKVVIRKSGKFSGVHTTKYHAMNGVPATNERKSIAGKFRSSSKATGWARIEEFQSGHKRCDTGKVHFTARKK